MAITSVSITFRGVTYPMAYDAAAGKYSAQLDAPAASSWKEDGHVFTGTVSATNRDDLGVVNTVTEETSVRVLETDAPELTVLTPEDWMISTTTAPVFRWLAHDAESGIDPETLSVKIDGAAQTGVRYSAFGDYYLCEWTGAVAEGAHVLTFDASDNDGNAATVALNYAVLLFITDRTQADVDRAAYLQTAVRSGTATEEELSEWETNLKGAYNASDMNRVGLGVYFLQQWGARYGYAVSATARRDWTDALEGPTRSEGAAYLADIQSVRVELPAFETTPQAPESMRFLGYGGANDIEQILTDAIAVMPRAALSFMASGEIAAGEI